MLFSRKLFALSILLLSVMLINSRNLSATGDEHPIIALSKNNIYAVSPLTSEARLLVERSPELDKELNSSLLELSPISPDNTKFAYVAPLYEMLDPAFESQIYDLLFIGPEDVTLVDIATGALIPITDQGANFADAVEHDTLTVFTNLTWSPDGKRLYFVSQQKSMRNRVPQKTIEYYDLEAGERHVLAKLKPHVRIMGVYGINQGVAVLDGDWDETGFELILYSADGSLTNTVKLEMLGVRECINGIIFQINPVFHAVTYHYGYYNYKTDDYESEEPIPTLLDVASGDKTPLEGRLFPAFISHANPDTSLRIVEPNLCFSRDSDRWVVTDTEGSKVSSMSLHDNEWLNEMALSPDGLSVAKIKAGEGISPRIVVMDANGSRELDFHAYQIIWGATDVIFAPLIEED